MIGDPIPDDDHVVRYVRPGLIDEGKVDGGAFVRAATHSALSVNWLEFFGGSDHEGQMDKVRRLVRLGLARHGRFAKLNVGKTKQYVSVCALEASLKVNLGISEDPLPATAKFVADPSHSKITGLPPEDNENALLVGDLIADCVEYPLYPARVD